jgi:hypothetical protein
MDRYRFLRKKSWESLEKFETRLNESTSRDWKVLNFVQDGGILVLLEREKP